MYLHEVFRIVPSGNKSFSTIEIDTKDLGSSVEFTAHTTETFGAERYRLNIGKLRVKLVSGEWRVMLVSIDEQYRNRGIAYELLYRAVLKLGPMKTSRLFSPKGTGLMKGLVRRGFATTIGPDDYLIHFNL